LPCDFSDDQSARNRTLTRCTLSWAEDKPSLFLTWRTASPPDRRSESLGQMSRFSYASHGATPRAGLVSISVKHPRFAQAFLTSQDCKSFGFTIRVWAILLDTQEVTDSSSVGPTILQ